ncbi:RagB/SusD family nutrient uptake outer membrane protein [uncultured Sunxiuqinia sp.]|uniref:RagB/SusD family nutrient uptake outer membrane protein n=1 Tax=uncultured Sunxiuqinia sp. TaxID=1573825 RepID=UPI002617B164|nr:RagB/SusD family nutrient uptake outer membrane protein [uncultured Sunxiuqinia sp.]
MKKLNNFLKRSGGLFIVLSILFSSCNDDFLEKYPQNQLSSGTFWQTEDDAMMALVGVYSVNAGWEGMTGKGGMINAADDSYDKDNNALWLSNSQLTSSHGQPAGYWSRAWSKITACNNFLDNIENVEMDAAKKAEMIAEVKFMRAHQYFWMSQTFGDVPLVTKVLTIEESNEVSRDPKSSIIEFVFNELEDAASQLPASRPASERGRILKSAALTIKGRLHMAQKQWSDAAAAFKQIIDLDVHTIYPEYKDLFLDGEGETASEIIYSRIYLEEAGYGHSLQRAINPTRYGGFHESNVRQDLVDDYLMNDGKTIEESPLYNPQRPFENRDPRLYYSVFLPGYTLYRGEVYQSHPDSAKTDDTVPFNSSNGYCIKKYCDEEFTGSFDLYGGDVVYIRYAEVLISYLEAKIEAGDNIDQTLLDQTINMLRSRPSVNMPPVTELDVAKLKEIVRRERRIELTFEGLRLWDLIRWDIVKEKMNGPVVGIKITDDPGNYTGAIQVNEDGHYVAYTHEFADKNYLWPIPQREIDINSNLAPNNPGY